MRCFVFGSWHAVTVCKTTAGRREFPYDVPLGGEFAMKTLLILPVLVAGLAGCAVPGPYYAAQPSDPYQWRTVSVTPVPLGTGARTGSQVEYPEVPAVAYAQQPVYVQAPVYAPAPIYAPAPVYAAPGYSAPYYWPPVSIGLDFVFSNHRHRGWGGRGWGGRGRR
jgi:hypothetical protein